MFINHFFFFVRVGIFEKKQKQIRQKYNSNQRSGDLQDLKISGSKTLQKAPSLMEEYFNQNLGIFKD